ncbi:Protein of unknown function [Cotesia congregata]|uniref:Uncharacterized protein n=1 Tax=Cotesia congregata TaxID=51543 RepID=A0A8J2H8R8_COTCN|nr:Protein of unknown function [Cotesia congregata]
MKIPHLVYFAICFQPGHENPAQIRGKRNDLTQPRPSRCVVKANNYSVLGIVVVCHNNSTSTPVRFLNKRPTSLYLVTCIPLALHGIVDVIDRLMSFFKGLVLFSWGKFDKRRPTDPKEMQRCPYLHEMKERLLSQPTPTDSLDMERLDGGTPVKEANLHTEYPAQTNPGVIPDPPEMPPDTLIGTVVKLNSDGYGSHTSPAHARQPLVPQGSMNPPLCLTPTHSSYGRNFPKNANVV